MKFVLLSLCVPDCEWPRVYYIGLGITEKKIPYRWRYVKFYRCKIEVDFIMRYVDILWVLHLPKS